MVLLLCGGERELEAIDTSRDIRDLVIDFWNDRKGLPHDVVRSIGQDSLNGFLWIGTEQGLARFDGSTFVILDSRNTPAMKDDKISCLAFDRGGGVWIGTERGGITHLIPTENRARHYGSRDGLKNDHIIAMLLDRKNRLIVATAGNVIQILEGERFSEIDPFAGGTADSITSIATDEGGGLWVGTLNSGLIMLKDDVRKVFSAPDHLYSNRVINLVEGPGNAIWGSCVDMSIFKIQEGAVQRRRGIPAQADEKPHGMFLSRSGEHWISTSRGRLISLKDGVPTRGGIPEETFPSTVSTVYEDTEGTLWAGVFEEGLFRLAESPWKVFNPDEGPAEANVRSVLPHGTNGLWVGTESGGLYRFVHGRFESYPLEARQPVLALARSPKGGVWVSVRGTGVRLIEGVSEVIHSARDHPVLEDVRAIHEDADGTLWLGTRTGGVVCIRGDEVIRYDKSHGLPSLEVRAILRDHTGRLWVGVFGGGVCRFDGSHFQSVEMDVPTANVRIKWLSEQIPGEIWVGTMGHGVGLLRGGRLQLFNDSNQNPDVIINAILHDDQGFAWVAGERALFRTSTTRLRAAFDSPGSLVNFTNVAGESIISIPAPNGGSQQPATLLPGGRVAFGTKRGLLVTYPAQLMQAQQTAMPILDRLEYDGVFQPMKDSMRLQPGSGNVNFEFTALSLKDSRYLEFEHRLIGVDKSWVRSQASRTARYTLLPPANYRFEVRVRAHLGAWSDPAGLKFTLDPYFHQTRLFKLLVFLGVTALVSVVVWVLMRLQADAHSVQQIQSIESERTRISQDLHDDMGAELSHILVLSGEFAPRSDSPGPHDDPQLNRIASCSRVLLRSLNEIVWATTPSNDNLVSLSSHIHKLAMDLFQGTTTRCRFDFPNPIPDLLIRAGVRHHLYMGVKEALNNALKHSRADSVVVRIEIRKQELCFMVVDDGAGFDDTVRASGRNGLRNLKSRLSIINATCDIESVPGSGTTIRFQVPLDQLEYRHQRRGWWLLVRLLPGMSGIGANSSQRSRDQR